MTRIALLVVVLVATLLAAGCSSATAADDAPDPRRVGSQPAPFYDAGGTLANATVASDGTWVTFTYVPDATDDAVAIRPVDPRSGRYGEDTWCEARWDHPTGPVSHAVLRRTAPRTFHLLVVRGGAAVQYTLENPYAR